MLITQNPAALSMICLGMLAAANVFATEPAKFHYAIAVHGGAGSWADVSEEERGLMEEDLRRALVAGRDVLAAGGSSLDAVEKVIASLEDSPYFNAGRGATFNADGRHELDAAIMDGRNLSCGAVAAVTVAKNPIKLACRVMTDTKHVLLVGAGADAFAESSGAERVAPDYFWTARQRARREKFLERSAAPPADHHGTVGCVALDRQGNLAAGTSTGGLEGKRPGRVGDSPLIGAGTYADNATCAVSCTGVGEEFIRRAVAYDIAARMKYGAVTLEEAVVAQFEERLQPNDGGLIALNAAGEITIRFNTRAMARALADSTGRCEAIIGP
jgi:L-asparaginase / beta-aspartyl-peptidase